MKPIALYTGNYTIGFLNSDKTLKVGEPLYTAPRELSKEDIYGLALEAGFMLSTQYGQAEDKLMPVSDGATLMKLAELILKKAREHE